MNNSFKKWNQLIGIILFIIASSFYLLTMERELSFWDCGEFIVSASKLGVTHAPGAATFQLIGALWSTLACGDGGSYAIVMNSMSAISSGATIMFLFWTITHFARRMFSVTVTNHINDDNYNTQLTKSQKYIDLGSGVIGASDLDRKSDV